MKEKVSSDFRHTTRSSVTSALATYDETDCQVECTNESQGPITVYQWTTTTSEIKGTTVKTCDYVCKYNEQAHIEP